MSKISRSVYQRACEENKRLLSDIGVLVSEGISNDKMLCIIKWRNKIRSDKHINDMLKSAAKEYIVNHKNELPEFLTKSIK